MNRIKQWFYFLTSHNNVVRGDISVRLNNFQQTTSLKYLRKFVTKLCVLTGGLLTEESNIKQKKKIRKFIGIFFLTKIKTIEMRGGIKT